MKDNLFELLLGLFEQSLSQLQKDHQDNVAIDPDSDDIEHTNNPHVLYVQPAKTTSTRVMTYDEQMKLTKASYQFLMRMKLWGIIDAEFFERVMNELDCAESRIITLEETKWVVRTLLADQLNEKQLAFLDLVFRQSNHTTQ